MKPFEPRRRQDEVIQRSVMETIKNRIKSWREHATIIGGRYQSGKSVAVEEALRGVRGVVEFTIENADWKKTMYEQERLDDIGQFKEVMRRAREKLKDFPDNVTKYPILLLDIPRATTEGLSGHFFKKIVETVMHFARVILFRFFLGRGIQQVSSTAKDMATDKKRCETHALQLKDYVQMVQTETVF